MVLIPFEKDEVIRVLKVKLLEDKKLELNKIDQTGDLFKSVLRTTLKGNFYSLFSLKIEFDLSKTDKTEHQKYFDFMTQFEFELTDNRIDIETLENLISSTNDLNIIDFRYLKKLLAVATSNTKVLKEFADNGLLNIIIDKNKEKCMSFDLF